MPPITANERYNVITTIDTCRGNLVANGIFIKLLNNSRTQVTGLRIIIIFKFSGTVFRG